MASVGVKLKKAREKKHLSWEEVSQKTKIHPKILEALEEDRAHQYVNNFYVKGFLKNYAHHLGLNEEEVVQEYLGNSPKDATSLSSSTLESSSWEEEIGVSPWVRQALTAILIFGFLFIAGVGILKMGKGEKKVLKSSRPVLVHRKSHTSLQRGVLTPYPFRLSKNEPLKLKLRVLENTWITVTADNQLMYQGLLAKGKEEIWTAQRRLELSLSDGGAVTLDLNRKSLGVPGEKGRPLEKLWITYEGWGLGEGP